MNTDRPTAETLRKARTHRTKVLRFRGTADDGGVVEWYAAYRGKFGWSACRGTGEWMDAPSESDIEDAFDVYDEADLVDLSETPEGLAL